MWLSNLQKRINILLLGTAIASAIAAGIIYVVVKNKKNKEEKIPKCVVDFNDSFMEYVDAIKKVP